MMTVSGCLHRVAARAVREISNTATVARLLAASFLSFKGASDSGVIVSLTSFPERIGHAWIPIEAMFRQTTPPEKVVLVLAEDEFPGKHLPRSIRRQVKRGLEILWTERNGRSYNKLLPVRRAYPDATIVTVDDDIIYGKALLSDLLAAATLDPQAIIGHRGRIMKYDGGCLAPYAKWPKADTRISSNSLFLTGVGGVLYPPHSLPEELLLDLDLAERLCPTADDIWFWAVARKAGARLLCLGSGQLRELGAQRGSKALRDVNCVDGKNDVQLRNVIDHFGPWENEQP